MIENYIAQCDNVYSAITGKKSGLHEGTPLIQRRGQRRFLSAAPLEYRRPNVTPGLDVWPQTL
jgi:hypothetical protein